MRTFSRRSLISLAGGVAPVLLGQPPVKKSEDPALREEMRKHDWGEGKLKPGDPAPDFALKEQKTGRIVTLSKFRDVRPVALVFGSFT